MFSKVLIANRGEIALRIQRACRDLGMQTVMVYSRGDDNAKYLRLADEVVCIGPERISDSYLNSAAIIAAAEITGAQAIHPGYGLLSENADFAEQVEKSGFTFIGPQADLIRLMGDKITAKQTARKYGLKTIPGVDGALPEDTDEAAAQIAKAGFPILIKAAAGGGGRGMRVVDSEIQARNVLPILRRETLAAFGDDTLYAERFLDNPRHVEVQVLADGKHAIHLGTRDCSLQRRHQKMIEEAPAFDIPAKKQNAVCEACTTMCRKIHYRSAGTFEFLYSDGEFYFIEMNTRVQVEHPVSEMITGIDIVAEQIKIAAGQPLTLRQKDVQFRGHAIECRITAEDPNTFTPAPGQIELYHPPGGMGVRVDSHIYSGYQVPPYYDSLIAKLIVHADNRADSLTRMQSALREFIITGIKTTLPLHAELIQDPVFTGGKAGISFLESRSLPPGGTESSDNT